MSDFDMLKIFLINKGFDFRFFNNNKLFFKNLLNNRYLMSFEGSFLVIFFSDFLQMSTFSFENCSLFACFYNGYFINNIFFNKINNFFNFFNKNYLFIITLLLYFLKLYFNLIMQLKFSLLAQINLWIEYLKKNYQKEKINL